MLINTGKLFVTIFSTYPGHGLILANDFTICFTMFTNGSLLGTESQLNAEQKIFARDEDGGMPLLDIVKKYKPTVLLGVTGCGGIFTEDLVREMASNCERPIIFPLSNPTTKAECTAEQAYEWTDGSCIFAAGSPFDEVQFDDGRVFISSQCNNMYVFPGLGLGATVCGARKVTDRMLYVAAEALANFTSVDDVRRGKVFPPIPSIREASHAIAVAVIEEAMREGLSTMISSEEAPDLGLLVAEKMYYPGTCVVSLLLSVNSYFSLTFFNLHENPMVFNLSSRLLSIRVRASG